MSAASIKRATHNCIALLKSLDDGKGNVNHRALLDEMEKRNGGPLPEKIQRLLAQIVAAYEAHAAREHDDPLGMMATLRSMQP